jgi:hypothetical protein
MQMNEKARIAKTLDRHIRLLIRLGPEITDEFGKPEVVELIDPAVAIFVEDDVEIHVLEKIRIIAAESDSPLLHRNKKFAHRSMWKNDVPDFPSWRSWRPIWGRQSTIFRIRGKIPCGTRFSTIMSYDLSPKLPPGRWR